MTPCCIAATAPWPPPPKASEHCFVVSISTKRRLCGMSLQIRHKSHEDDVSLPLPLSRGGGVMGLTKDDYDHKIMKPLESRLAQWNGGYADACLTTWALVILVLFLVSFMTPSFRWMHDENPFGILALMICHLMGFYALWWYIRSENHALIDKIEHDMRQWHGIRVTMKRVAHLPPAASPRNTSGMYCFCVTMQSRALSGEDDDDDDERTLPVSEVDDSDDDEAV